MIKAILEITICIFILLILAKPLGIYIAKVYENENVFLSKVVKPIEKFIYKVLKLNSDREMNWKEYSLSIIIFSVLGFIILYLIQIGQAYLPLNPENMKNISWDLAFNTTSSFISNTNWQAYSGETSLSYFTQMIGLTVQNFLSAAVGIVVLIALIRGFSRKNSKTIGNFWSDLIKSVLYILIPLSLIVSIALVSQGVVQNFKPYQEVKLIDPIELSDGNIINTQIIPTGPAASQIAIKQLGTNGGGFFGVNSAHPLENPNLITNVIEVISISIIPIALCFTFGYMIRNKKQGRAILISMMVIFILALIGTVIAERAGTSILNQNQAISMIDSATQVGGNMEGKELRFGTTHSSLWAVMTTSASNGSVNSMHSSYTPLGGLILMVLMQIGEVVFGGVGSGLYAMLAFAIITVFIAGLMVGRTPEYLGKKIEPFEMKMAILAILIPPVMTLIGTSLICVLPETPNLISTSGPHAFSEILYNLTSTANNNGSAFAGFMANTPIINIITGLIMLISRFIPMILILSIANSLASKKKIPVSAGTLPTHNGIFIGMLIFVVLIIGALSFLPALALGPITEHLEMFF